MQILVERKGKVVVIAEYADQPGEIAGIQSNVCLCNLIPRIGRSPAICTDADGAIRVTASCHKGLLTAVHRRYNRHINSARNDSRRLLGHFAALHPAPIPGVLLAVYPGIR